jgi:hypothetical protein
LFNFCFFSSMHMWLYSPAPSKKTPNTTAVPNVYGLIELRKT